MDCRCPDCNSANFRTIDTINHVGHLACNDCANQWITSAYADGALQPPGPKDGGPASDKSLRDEFAGKAMAAMLANQNMTWHRGDLSRDAYQQADSMLAERSREQADG